MVSAPFFSPEVVKIDALSVILSTVGFGGAVYGFSVSVATGWMSEIVRGSTINGMIALILFGIHQTRKKIGLPFVNLVTKGRPFLEKDLSYSFPSFINFTTISLIFSKVVFNEIANSLKSTFCILVKNLRSCS